MMSLGDAFRRLFSFGSLYRIKMAIDGLSDEDFVELLAWMQDHFSDVTADPHRDSREGRWTKVKGKTWY